MLDNNEELNKWFTQQVKKNLHVVFTMNPSTDGHKDRAATFPALFNRGVLNWFGDWSDSAFFQVGREFTIKMDLDQPSYQAPDYFPVACPIGSLPPNHRDAVVNAMVFNEKRSGLEEEQLHNNVGLNKIAETVAQDEEMQKSLAVKSAELKTKKADDDCN